ncbi:MAG: hypothetical protein NZ556_07795 [Fimbriimonadales bacterium]|nr:hypothetical protein [Fimbriimonadales bacterium]
MGCDESSFRGGGKGGQSPRLVAQATLGTDVSLYRIGKRDQHASALLAGIRITTLGSQQHLLQTMRE